jgi:protein-disulfide isomerase
MAGQTAGVNGTPALFVNGIPIEGGAVAFEVVAEALDRELRRTGM